MLIVHCLSFIKLTFLQTRLRNNKTSVFQLRHSIHATIETLAERKRQNAPLSALTITASPLARDHATLRIHARKDPLLM